MIHLNSPAGQSVSGVRNDTWYPSRSLSCHDVCTISLAPRVVRRSPLSTNRRPSSAPPRASDSACSHHDHKETTSRRARLSSARKMRRIQHGWTLSDFNITIIRAKRTVRSVSDLRKKKQLSERLEDLLVGLGWNYSWYLNIIHYWVSTD